MQIRQHQELRIVSSMNSDGALAGETLAGSLLQLKFAAECRELWHKRLGVIQKKPASGEHLELPNMKTPSKLHPYQKPSLLDRSKNVSTENQRISAARVTYERIMYQAFSMEVMRQLKQTIACSIIDASAPRQILYRASSRTKFKLNPPDYFLNLCIEWMRPISTHALVDHLLFDANGLWCLCCWFWPFTASGKKSQILAKKRSFGINLVWEQMFAAIVWPVRL